MWPLLMGLARTYAPYIVWPIAAVVGVVGYNVERVLRKDKPIPARKSIVIERLERNLHEADIKDPTHVDSIFNQEGQTRSPFDGPKS